MSYSQHLDEAKRMLLAGYANPRRLAEISSFEAFRFFNSADLRGVDLSNQDLHGLNFDQADLRGASLLGSSFDAGAFNKSLLDKENLVLRDEFEISLEDMLELRRPMIFYSYVYAFRPDMLDYFAERTFMTYDDFARGAKISTGTLRSARRGYTVADVTAFSIADFLMSALRGEFRLVRSLENADVLRLRQPSVAVFKDSYYGARKHVPLSVIMEIAERHFIAP